MSFVQTEMAVYRYGDQLNIDYTPGQDYNAGDVVDLGTFVGVFLEFAKNGVLTSLCIRGVFDFLKETGAAINLGDIVLWDATQHVAYVTGGGYSDDACIGKCVAAAGSSDLTVRVSMIETAKLVSG